jgi:GntR family transcriptional regulator, rspAB operon transcriptional repressor
MTHAFDARALTAIEELPGSLAQRVYHSLREAILSLPFPPGTMLRKGPICGELGVSRSPVAEAIARLASEGLVDVIPQSATKVSCFSMDEIHEAAFMREALELAAVGKVTVEHTSEQYRQLVRNVRLQQLLAEDKDSSGLYQADEAFHTMLMEFTGFPGLASTVSIISLKLKRPRLLLMPEPGRPTEVVKEHLAIVNAIRERDAGAAQEAMRFHLSQLVSRFAPLEKQHPEFFRSRQTPSDLEHEMKSFRTTHPA